MSISHPERICMLPHLSGVGGMVSFQQKMAAGLAARGIRVCYSLADRPYDAVLVVGGTRQLAGLWRARRRGIPIVQRLDGMNWLHRVRAKNKSLRTGLKHYLRAEYGNLILASIRSRLAQRIIYQSEFSQRWWERVYGPTPAPNKVVYNGVDLEVYTPDGPTQRPEDFFRILMVEGSLLGGYEAGLEAAIRLVVNLEKRLPLIGLKKPLELMVAGRVQPELQRHWDQQLQALDEAGQVTLNWAGLLAGEKIPMLDRSAHLLYSADINAACPNSVIEALACGLPVVSFDTGSLPELVVGDSGRIAPYGGDPWLLEAPEIPGLVQAAAEILHNQPVFREAARARATRSFGLDQMVSGYLEMM